LLASQERPELKPQITNTPAVAREVVEIFEAVEVIQLFPAPTEWFGVFPCYDPLRLQVQLDRLLPPSRFGAPRKQVLGQMGQHGFAYFQRCHTRRFRGKYFEESLSHGFILVSVDTVCVSGADHVLYFDLSRFRSGHIALLLCSGRTIVKRSPMKHHRNPSGNELPHHLQRISGVTWHIALNNTVSGFEFRAYSHLNGRGVTLEPSLVNRNPMPAVIEFHDHG
jgi:hypothetical protein